MTNPALLSPIIYRYASTAMEEIEQLGNEITSNGYTKALAEWTHNQASLPPTSHRAYFRKFLNPRAVQSNQARIPGPLACDMNARFRSFAFTYLDVQLSRGRNKGTVGAPFTPMEVVTEGGSYTVIKFGNEVRTVLSEPLEYYSDSGTESFEDTPILEGPTTTLPDGMVSFFLCIIFTEWGEGLFKCIHLTYTHTYLQYTICFAEEIAGTKLGEPQSGINNTYSMLLQVLVGDICTPSITDVGGEDGLGDGTTVTAVKDNASNACNAKCNDKALVKYITIGNPPVDLPDGYDKTDLTTLDINSNVPNVDIVNINTIRTLDSNWLLKEDISSVAGLNSTCSSLPDPAQLAFSDLSSKGRGQL